MAISLPSSILSRVRRQPAASPSNEPNLLTTLPTELFEQIGEHLEESELIKLRLVDQDAAAKLTKLFARKLFSCRTLHLTNLKSLRQALDIAKHEYFGPALRELVIYINERLRRRRRRWGIDLVRRKRWTKVLQAENTDVQILREIFGHLSPIGRLQKVWISDINGAVYIQDGQVITAPRGLEGVPFRPFRKTQGHPGNESARPLELVVDALCSSGLPLESFKVAASCWKIPLDNVSVSSLVHCKTVFSSLKALTLHLCPPAMELLETDAAFANAEPFFNAIDAAPLLETLTVSLHLKVTKDDNWTPASLHPLVFFMAGMDDKTIVNLHTLVLEGHLMSYGRAVQFLKRQPKLRHLELKETIVVGVDVVKVGDWNGGEKLGEILVEEVEGLEIEGILVDEFTERLSRVFHSLF